MRKISALIVIFLFFTFSKSVSAIYDPLSVPNNKFGIHLTQDADLEEASKLVNSSGGDWGYVTIVIRKDERDTRRWQNVFNQMRRLHLIPIVRIATMQLNGGWEKPSVDEIDGWIDFLASLNWPMQNMYVAIGNEPNHAKEWGGEISPEGYALYLNTFIDKAHAKSQDFFLLPAALDFSARSDSSSLDASLFLGRMLKSKPDILDRVDGWNSHSYPNPDFSGSEKATGKGTVASFAWELSYLKSLGVTKELPVFITETGWAHNTNVSNQNLADPSELGDKFKYAFEHVWNDKRVVAVTPFIFTYKDPPFDIFSWKKSDGEFYSFVDTFKSLPKPKGDPLQKTSGEIISIFTPPLIKSGQIFIGALFVENTGQSIWNEEDLLLLTDLDNSIEITKMVSFEKMEPEKKSIVLFEARARGEGKQISGNLAFFEGEKMITNSKFYKSNVYSDGNVIEKFILLRNGIASAFWMLRVRFLGY